MNAHKKRLKVSYRKWGWRVALAVILLAGLVPLGSSVCAQTTDPAADYQMWRDDEMYAPIWSSTSNYLQSTSYEYKPADGTLPALSYCNAVHTPSATKQMGAAAGRMMSPYYDQVIMAYASSGGNLDVAFADQCDSVTHAATGPTVQLGPIKSMPSLGTDYYSHVAYFDIATGDMDKQQDANLDYRDEVVVAYAGITSNVELYSLNVAVIDYTNSPATAPTVTSITLAEETINRRITQSAQYGVIPLAVTTGDFNGDKHKEIAVAYVKTNLSIGVVVFRYTTTVSDTGVVTHQLTKAQSLTSIADQWSASSTITRGWQPTTFRGSIDAVAGDFDGIDANKGTGRDELSVGTAVAGYVLFSDVGLSGAGVDVKTFKFNDTLVITEVNHNSPVTIPLIQEIGDVTRVQMAAGLFKFVPDPDPLKDYGPSRKQVVYATQDMYNPGAQVNTLIYDSNLVPTPTSGTQVWKSGATMPQYFSLTAGGLKGVRSTATAADAVWSLGINIYNQSGQTLYLLDFNPNTGAPLASYITKVLSTTANTLTQTTVVPLVAYDYGQPTQISADSTVLAGDSLYLGAPMYFVLEGSNTFDYILQEPPKHVYWNPTGGTDGKGAVVNISGKDQFTVGTTNTTTIGVTNTSKDNTDSSWGVSESASISAGFGSIVGPPKIEATLSESVGYEYKEHDATYDSTMEQRTVSLSHNADRDDAIRYRVQDINVWRYYVYGAKFVDTESNPLVGYFDITSPGTVQELSPAGTVAIDVYQPVHENNNILSYPASTGGVYNPADMGSFKVQCTDLSGVTCDKDPDTGDPLTTQTINGPLVDKVTWSWGGTSGEQTWADNRTETKGKERSTSKTLKSSEDIKTTMRIKIPMTTIKISGTGEVAANQSWSWGSASTMETTTNELTSIKMSIPTGNSSEGYFFYPVFYVASNGTMKVSFAVDPMTENSESFWKGLYGSQPDPALNMPNRFKGSVSGGQTVWEPNKEENRNLIRGFFVKRWEADAVTGEYTQYAGSPTAGDVARLECRVYNYSTGQSVSNLKVRFDYIEIDPATDLPVPGAVRTPIIDVQMPNGTGTGNDYIVVPYLDPRGMAVATVNWQIPTFSGTQSKDYRIYVVLDPDNTIQNEKYETESRRTQTYCIANCSDPKTAQYIDPGQNNEGWRTVTAMPPPPPGPGNEQLHDVHFKSDALAAVNTRGSLVTHTVQAYEDQPLKIRVRIDTDYMGSSNSHVLLYDGYPGTGKLIGMKLAYTGSTDGNYVWFEWTTSEPGPHMLYAKVVEGTLDTNPGNNISDELKVIVIKEPKGPKK